MWPILNTSQCLFVLPWGLYTQGQINFSFTKEQTVNVSVQSVSHNAFGQDEWTVRWTKHLATILITYTRAPEMICTLMEWNAYGWCVFHHVMAALWQCVCSRWLRLCLEIGLSLQILIWCRPDQPHRDNSVQQSWRSTDRSASLCGPCGSLLYGSPKGCGSVRSSKRTSERTWQDSGGPDSVL